MTFEDWWKTENAHYGTLEWIARAAWESATKAEREARSWQPIETAPKDGSRVLVYANGWAVVARRWNGEFCVGNLPGEAIYPTHWMPLPEPPLPANAELRGASQLAGAASRSNAELGKEE